MPGTLAQASSLPRRIGDVLYHVKNRMSTIPNTTTSTQCRHGGLLYVENPSANRKSEIQSFLSLIPFTHPSRSHFPSSSPCDDAYSTFARSL
jgi:hypothetical protein